MTDDLKPPPAILGTGRMGAGLLRRLKRATLAALSAPGATTPFHPFMRGRAVIFMLHRFSMPDLGVRGTEPAALRAALESLRRRRYPLVQVGELFRRLRGEGPPLNRAVAFTIDDGYLDAVEMAAPAFAAYDCPVTTFLTTGFLDGTVWLWWDRVEYILMHTSRSELELRVGDVDIELTWSDRPSRRRATDDFTARCKTLPEQLKLAVVDALATAAEVDVPAAPPAPYAAMTWDQVRTWEQRGMSFGPHTITHPILASCDDEQSAREIAGSWVRLNEVARRPVPVFCYPNGRWRDFGPREVASLRGLSFEGAVVSTWGLADTRLVRHDPDEVFHTRRFGFPDDVPHLLQYVSGLEQLKLGLYRLVG